MNNEIEEILDSTWPEVFIESWIPINVKDASHVKEAKLEARKQFVAALKHREQSLFDRVDKEVIGEDERIDIQSEFDKIDVPHLETDKYPGLDGVRQASRNILRNRQRQSLTTLRKEYEG